MTNTTATLDERIAAFITEIESSPEYAVEAAKSEIAIAVYERMTALGLSRADLARRLGKSRAYISRFFSGGDNVTIETLIGFARALECDYQDFIAPRLPASRIAAPLSVARDEPEPMPMRKERRLSLVDENWVTENRASLRLRASDAPCDVLDFDDVDERLAKVA